MNAIMEVVISGNRRRDARTSREYAEMIDVVEHLLTVGKEVDYERLDYVYIGCNVL